MKINLTIILALLTIQLCNAQITQKSIVKDFKKLEGSWQGSLTYLDYSSGEPFTMDAALEIKAVEKEGSFAFSNIYPKEPGANATDTIVVSDDGKYIGKELIKSRRKLANGSREIITVETGTDGNDNKPAIFRHTYTFGRKTFSKKKEVQFIGTREWIKRHEYQYVRQNPRKPIHKKQ